MKKLALSCCLIAAVLASGCASVLNDRTQQVNVISGNGKPFQGTVDGVPFTGPGMVPVKRENGAKIFNSTTEGCAKATAAESSVDTKFFGNVLFFYYSTTSSAVDLVTGKMWRYAETVVIPCSQ
jgi:hypothetical protein